MSGLQAALSMALATIAICTTIVAVGRSARSRYLDPLRQMVDEWRGEAGVPAKGIAPRLGALERITLLEEQIRAISAEVKPNGGGSMRDAVNRIDQAVGGGETK